MIIMRMGRGEEEERVTAIFMKKSDIFWQTYLNLEREVIEVSKFIFITDVKMVNENGKEVLQTCKAQLDTFSPHIADLLVRCCVQIEAISKELYHDNGGQKPRGRNDIFFDEDCLKLIDIKWETHRKCVFVVAPFFNLTKDENTILRPLKEAHKKQGTYWERAYQAVKHDRFASLSMGNVKALIQALAALYLLNLYYRNDSWVIKYQDISKQDYSSGSSIFAVKPPSANQLWEGNMPNNSDSPYVVTYKDDVYKKIEDIRLAEKQAMLDYLSQQPEFQDTEFLNHYKSIIEKDLGFQQPFTPFCILERYRFNRRIPSTLPFIERKQRLLNSKEWNGWIHQNNQHLKEDELTEDNIQHEIDLVGDRWGRQVWKSFLKDGEWLSIALGSGLCEVYIP